MNVISKKRIRKVTFDILNEVFFDKKLLNVAIDEKFGSIALNEEDKAFIKYESTGVIEKIDVIDKIIKDFSKIKVDKLDKDVLIALRIGIYELKYMDKVPSYATINELVDIIKLNYKNNKSGRDKINSAYVNAILRNVDRKHNASKSKIINSDTLANKSSDVIYDLNDEEKLSDKKYCYFRIYNNEEKKVLSELKERKIEYYPYDGKLTFNYAKVYRVNKYKDVLLLDSFRDGNILISDASSIFLTDRLANHIKEKKDKVYAETSELKLLDVCAAPGGKILGLIDLICDDFKYFYAEARDISEKKIQKIRDNVNRLKAHNIDEFVKDASIYDDSDFEKYDVVICDVPCSGLGVISKKPDVKLNFSKEKLSSLCEIQKKILDTSSRYVKPNGIISYSTCTTTREENEDIVNMFLNNKHNFNKIYEKRIDIGDENKADGFYICFIEKI